MAASIKCTTMEMWKTKINSENFFRKTIGEYNWNVYIYPTLDPCFMNPNEKILKSKAEPVLVFDFEEQHIVLKYVT